MKTGGSRAARRAPCPRATNRPTLRQTARHGATWRERWPIPAVGRTARLRRQGGGAFGDGGPRAG